MSIVPPDARNKLRWWQCFAFSFAIEAVLADFLAVQYYHPPLSIFQGADNPLFYWVGYLLLLPGSIAFKSISIWSSKHGLTDNASMVLTTILVAFLNIKVFAVLLRSFYRRSGASRSALR